MYLSLSLKTGSCINPRSSSLEATFSQTKLPAKSTWQVFIWKCRHALHNHLVTLGGEQVASYMISVFWKMYQPLFFCQCTHIVVRRGKRLQISIDHTLETLRVPRAWSQSFVWKESFFLENNQVLHLTFPCLSINVFHFIDRDFVNTFLIHKHIPVSEWMRKETWDATT